MTRSPRIIRREYAMLNVVVVSGNNDDFERLEAQYGCSLSTIIDQLWDESLEAGLDDVANGCERLYNTLTGKE